MSRLEDVQVGVGAIGRSVPRRDAHEKLRGKAQFAGDIVVPRMLHGKVLRSPVPHARVIAIDASAAEAMPGVVCVLTAADLADLDPYWGHAIRDRPVVAIDRVRFAGEPVAAVAAEDEATAAAAVERIDVVYEELDVVGTVLVSRAWSVAGLDVVVPRATRIAAMVISTLLALAIAGSGALDALRKVLAGQLGELEFLASNLGDIVSLAAIAPIVLTARMLRGGSLAWPWRLRNVPVATSQSRTVRSRPADASVLPSGARSIPSLATSSPLPLLRPLGKKNLSSKSPCGVCTYLFAVARLTVDSCMWMSSATSRSTMGLRLLTP